MANCPITLLNRFLNRFEATAHPKAKKGPTSNYNGLFAFPPFLLCILVLQKFYLRFCISRATIQNMNSPRPIIALSLLEKNGAQPCLSPSHEYRLIIEYQH